MLWWDTSFTNGNIILADVVVVDGKFLISAKFQLQKGFQLTVHVFTFFPKPHCIYVPRSSAFFRFFFYPEAFLNQICGECDPFYLYFRHFLIN